MNTVTCVSVMSVSHTTLIRSGGDIEVDRSVGDIEVDDNVNPVLESTLILKHHIGTSILNNLRK
jgi:hypothetical protein